MKIVFFTYDMPHRKSQEFIFRLALSKIKLDLVIASPPKRLNIKRSKLKTYPEYFANVHPREICEFFNIPYLVRDHNDTSTVELLREIEPDIGIIGGARILSSEVIDSFNMGIINFHPGLIPENRGLDTIVWAVYRNIPQGMTVHFIDKNIDSGKIISKYIAPIYKEDTLIDIGVRLLELEYKMLVPEILKILNSKTDIKTFTIKNPPGKNRAGLPEVDEYVIKNFEDYKRRWAYDLNGHLCYYCSTKLELIDNSGNLLCPKCGKEFSLLENNVILEKIIQ